MAQKRNIVSVTRWQGSQHPSVSSIIRIMKDQGLRPYMWTNSPNYRYAVRSHNYDKVLFVIEGSLEIQLPDTNERVVLRPGDRIDIPSGMRHGTIIGSSGAKCVEAGFRETKARRQS